MRKVNNRSELSLFLTPPGAAKPEAQPPPVAPTIDPAQAALVEASAQMAKLATTLVEQEKARPKKLEAKIHRDSKGRMDRVEIFVV